MSVVTLLAAFFACFLAIVWYSLVPEATGGLAQLGVALAGLVPAFGFLVRSIDSTGQPERWLGATLAIYVGWLVVVAVS